MKKCMQLLGFAAVLLSVSFSAQSQTFEVINNAANANGLLLEPVTDLGTWEEFTENMASTSVAPDGMSMGLTAVDTDGYAQRGIDTDAIGVMISVTPAMDVVSYGFARAELHDLGTLADGTQLRAELRAERAGDSYRLQWRIRQFDAEGKEGSRFMQGYVGGTDSSVWADGDTLILAVARVGNEVWFFSPGRPALTKVALLGGFTPAPEHGVAVSAYSEMQGDSVNANINAVWLIQPMQ